MKDWTQAGLLAQCQALAAGELSSRKLVEAYLARIEEHNSELNAYLLVDGQGAKKKAELWDSAARTGHTKGTLGGTVAGIKDLLVTKDIETTAGSKMLQGWVPPYNGHAIEQLEEAGSIVVGKLNLDEFAMGSSSEHSAFGPTKNPWDLSRVPGGSSGGSAAAVAADLCSFSLGSDTGGSIRQPASFCGIVGVKPSYGRVSRYGLIAYASSFDCIGPMARTVEDAALVLSAIAGPDPRDATSSAAFVPNFLDACGAGIAGLRIGIPREMNGSEVDDEVSAGVQRALRELEQAGATLVPISLPHTKHALATYYLLATAEASSNLARYDGMRFGHRATENKGLDESYEQSRSEGFGPEVKRRILLGTFALRRGHFEAYYQKAQKVRTLLAKDFTEAFGKVDAIASPTAPTTAFSLGAKKTPMEMYQADIFTLGANLAGLPGMSLCCGFDGNSLPIGLQFLAAPFAEETLFRLGAEYQRKTDYHRRRPAL